MTAGAGLVFWAKVPLIAPRSVREWRRLLRTDGWTPDELAQYREERGRAIARFAFKNSPFYKEFYRDHGIRSADFDAPGMLASLPLVTKSLLREHNAAVPTPEANDRTAARSVTSGSTGEPLSVLRDLRVPARAFEWRLQSWWGVDPWADVATIDRYYRSNSQARNQRLLYWPARRFQLDTFDISADALTRFIANWQVVRPDVLNGYIGGVLAVARLAAARGIALAPPKAIAVTAGPLLPAQRNEIERFFRAPVYDHYRTSEANWLAGECIAQSGLHTFDDTKDVEVLLNGSDAGVADGEVVVTDLMNRAFPIVRYATGDVSRRIEGECACGRPHRRIEQIRGRVLDFLSLPSGKVIVGGLTGTFAGMDEFVRQFQIYQASDYSIEVRVMLTDSDAARARASERVDLLRRNVAGETTVEMRVVDEIDAPRGKLRYVVSDAPRNESTTPIAG